MPEGHVLVSGPPSVEEYRRLRAESGLTPKSALQAQAAIAGSRAFRHVVGPNGLTVAMGRVIGDGGWYFLIADMATLPRHQGDGLGGAVLDELLAHIRSTAPSGAYVTLTADPPGRRLYRSRGFAPIDADQSAMQQIVRPGAES